MSDDVLSLITEVWTPASAIFAIIAGAALGFFAIGHVASDPAYASGQASPLEYGLLVALLAGAVGLVFFSFQILATYAVGDTQWTRVVSRLFVWFLYSGAIGHGTTLRLQWDRSRKRAQTHERALRELDK